MALHKQKHKFIMYSILWYFQTLKGLLGLRIHPSNTIISQWNLECASTFIIGLPQSSLLIGCLLGLSFLVLFSWPSLDNANIKVYDYEDIIGILLHRMFLFVIQLKVHSCSHLNPKCEWKVIAKKIFSLYLSRRWLWIFSFAIFSFVKWNNLSRWIEYVLFMIIIIRVVIVLWFYCETKSDIQYLLETNVWILESLNILRQSFEISAHELMKCQNKISNKCLRMSETTFNVYKKCIISCISAEKCNCW
jgi:hypothetical protein